MNQTISFMQRNTRNTFSRETNSLVETWETNNLVENFSRKLTKTRKTNVKNLSLSQAGVKLERLGSSRINWNAGALSNFHLQNNIENWETSSLWQKKKLWLLLLNGFHLRYVFSTANASQCLDTICFIYRTPSMNKSKIYGKII